MSPKLHELQRKLAKLEKQAKELKALKADYNHIKEFRKMLVKYEVD